MILEHNPDNYAISISSSYDDDREFEELDWVSNFFLFYQ